MYVVEIFLPLSDAAGRPFPQRLYREIREKLVGRFGGLTAFTRSPAEGLWENEGAREKDDIVIFEVMANALDRGWWQAFREELERMFRQEEIVIRARPSERL